MKKIVLSAALFAVSLTMSAQVGINAELPEGALDVKSTTSGLVFPRVANTTVVVNAKNNADPVANGTMIYDLSDKCIKAFENGSWSDCFSASVVSIPGNTTCVGAAISASSCAGTPGATINDDATTIGIEYDWTDGATYLASDVTTQALVEFDGQCWYRINADNNPDLPSGSWDITPGAFTLDKGYYSYYENTELPNEGLLYQWSAAMNGSTTERAQGICAPGFHIPSDCEWMYLENALGMSVADQSFQGSGRGGDVPSTRGFGFFLADEISGSKTGFKMLWAAFRNSAQTTTTVWSGNSRGDTAFFQSSSIGSQRQAYNSNTETSYATLHGLTRTGAIANADAISVRCIKD